MNETLEWINKLGLPLVALVAIGLGVRSACQWLAKEVVKPLIDDVAKPVAARHISFVDGLEERDKKQMEQIADVKTKQEAALEAQRIHNQSCDAIHKLRPT